MNWKLKDCKILEIRMTGYLRAIYTVYDCVYVIDNEYTFEAKMFVPLLILPAERTEIHSQLNYAS